jgi:hypothetical protein
MEGAVPTDLYSHSVPSHEAKLPSTERERAVSLITLQSFEGSFALTSGLASILGTSLTELEAKLMEFVPTAGPRLPEEQKKRIWATVLALCLFEGKLTRERETWELVVEKAKNWISELDTVENNDVDRLQVLAKEVLN